MTSFLELNLTDDVNRAISESGYAKPTEIQSQLIPIIRDGSDAIGLSQTGSGKTAAFVLPLLDKLVRSKKRAHRGSCSVLVLSPTRELSNQIADTVRGYGKYVNYTQAVIVGGVSYPPQIKALKRGTDIVVATPGRILDHIENDIIAMDETTVIVLDEADQMLDFGFLPAIRKILATLPKVRQTILLSATMPKAIKDLTREFMNSPVTVEATPESRPVETITQQVIYVEKHRKNMALLEIVSQKEVERTIVFMRTKFAADRVQKFLNNYGITAVSLHGNKSQGQRQRALGQFRSGEAEVMVATDVAGRGIDIDDVSHVINVDLPNIPESYVHRIGRTGRAGRQGAAISFCSKAERSYLKDIERLIGNSIPKSEDKPGAAPAMSANAKPVDMDKFDRDDNRPGRNRKSRSSNDRGKNADRNRFSHGKRKSENFGEGERPRRAKPKQHETSFKEDRAERPARDKFGGDKPFSKKARSPRRNDGTARFDRKDRPRRDDTASFDRKDRPRRDDGTARFDRKDRPKRDDGTARFDRKTRPKRDDSASFDRKDRPRRDDGTASSDRKDRPRRDDGTARFDRKDRPRRDDGTASFDRKDRPKRNGGTISLDRKDRPKRDDNHRPQKKKISGKKFFGKSGQASKSGKPPSRGRNFAATAEQGLKRKRSSS